MNTNDYFEMLESGFKRAYEVASAAKAVGFDPNEYVEAKSAPDLAGRVEALMNTEGLAKLIREQEHGKTRSELAFAVVKSICINKEFEGLETIKRIELAVRTGLAIATEGVLVAPTEGVQGITRCRNGDNTDYIVVSYAGPIRSAGGTTVALSVAFADYARQFFGIGQYKATQEEIERYVEEIGLYHTIVRLQYRPNQNEIRNIVKNCSVCVDGVSTEDRDVSVHANITRQLYDFTNVMIPNRIRGGVALVISSIAQKAKAVMKEVKKVGMDWSWLSKNVAVEKASVGAAARLEKEETFLDELVAGRPILAYPSHFGGFRLRYGRSRNTGISAKGFSPATMVIAGSFIGIGTQLKIETPGKGCIAAPVDTIEGPFVVLRSGEALRIDDAEQARLLTGEVERIVSLGDILVTYGDFRKTNSTLLPSSYVEELWQMQLTKAGGSKVDNKKLSFKEAYELSFKYSIPLHPRFLFEFSAAKIDELAQLALAISSSTARARVVFEVERVEIENTKELKSVLERLAVAHKVSGSKIVIERETAQSLLASLGFAYGEQGTIKLPDLGKHGEAESSLEFVNKLAPFRVMKRSTFIGARIGRPEKARERLMKPAPNVLFPIAGHGGKERNLANAYAYDAKRLGKETMQIELAKHRCGRCGTRLNTPYCYRCNAKAELERTCPKCGTVQFEARCVKCGSETVAYDERAVSISSLVANALARLQVAKMPNVKGVRGLINRDKVAEPLEKGVLRAMHGIYIFKDGTSRFDATNAPLTHFYPKEIGTSVEKLRAMGYDKDYEGKELGSEDQLVELRHQDIIINRNGAAHLFKVSKFVDDMLARLYGLEPYYNLSSQDEMVGQLVLTLSPHTSCAVLNRIVGFTDASVGFVHPYTLCARRRDADGDEDTVMLLLDVLINFSRAYLPSSIGGTMDEPLLITTRVMPEEVDDQAHAMEVVRSYPPEFYEKTFASSPPGEVEMELVQSRLGREEAFSNLLFTHSSSANAVKSAPKRSTYTQLKTMQEKIDAEFRLMDMLDSIEKKDAAKRLIMSHFIPDLIGNLHSFSRQRFRCSTCNAKYRRVPLSGKCMRDGGKLLLTISKGGIEKYLVTATTLAERYDLDLYTKQRLKLIKEEIEGTFNEAVEAGSTAGQFDLSKFI